MDDAPSDGPDGFAHKVDVNFGGVFLEFRQDLGNVFRRGQTNHDVQLFQLDINRIVVLDKEYLQKNSQ